MIKPIEECKTVAELLASPERWIKNSWAKDAEGNAMFGNNPKAVCFCLGGAIHRIYGELNPIERSSDFVIDSEAYAKLRSLLNINPLSFNDAPETTYEIMYAKVLEAGI